MTAAPAPRADRADACTVWYDDDCGLCSAVVRRLAPRTDAGVAWRANRDLADPVLIRTAADAIVVTAGSSAWTGVEAVRRILARTGWAGRCTARVLDLPGVRAVAGVGYRWVAAHRSTISARLGLPAACALAPGAAYDPGHADGEA